VLRHKRRTITIISLALALGVAGVASLWHVGAGRLMGLSERDYAQVQPGMSRGQVSSLLGDPDERSLMFPQVPDGTTQVSSRTEEPPFPIAEVWEWRRGLQTIVVSFDSDGRVVHKRVGY